MRSKTAKNSLNGYFCKKKLLEQANIFWESFAVVKVLVKVDAHTPQHRERDKQDVILMEQAEEEKLCKRLGGPGYERVRKKFFAGQGSLFGILFMCNKFMIESAMKPSGCELHTNMIKSF